MAIHFEQLWEKCENLHKEINSTEPNSSILDELAMKINLYKIIDSKTEVPEAERQEGKSRVMGEILLTLTKISLRDNINVFESLSIAQQYRSAELKQINSIPHELRLPGS